MEREDEIAGLGNSYATANRNYDARIARWYSLDPAKMKYMNKSPFNAFNNNPVMYKDPGGDDTYIFMGNYKEKVQAGAIYTVINGEMRFDLPLPDDIIPRPGNHRYIWKNGFDTGKDLRIHSPYTIHGGDGNEDLMSPTDQYVRGLEDLNGYIEEEFDEYLDQQGHCSIQPYSNIFLRTFTSPLFKAYSIFNFAKESTHGGDLDFKNQVPSLSKNENVDGMGKLYLIDGTYYNRNEAGNFLFGYAAAKMGFALPFVKAGGEIYVDVLTNMDDDEAWEVAAVVKGYSFYMLKTLGKENMQTKEYQHYLELYNNASERIDYYEGNLDSNTIDDSDKDTNSEETNNDK